VWKEKEGKERETPQTKKRIDGNTPRSLTSLYSFDKKKRPRRVPFSQKEKRGGGTSIHSDKGEQEQRENPIPVYRKEREKEAEIAFRRERGGKGGKKRTLYG